MSQRLLFEEQSELLVSFAASGMTLDGEFYPLRMWARITDEKDGGFLPTPTAQMGGFNQSPGGAPRPSLETMARHNIWPTPTVQDSENDGGPSTFFRNSLPLNAAVKAWRTPNATDGKNRGTAEYRKNRKGQIQLQTQVGGQLNPAWVEWLMGYPCGWTVLEDWATQWFRPKRGKPLKD